MIPLKLYFYARVQTALCTFNEEDPQLLKNLEGLLNDFGWNISSVRTPKGSSWEFVRTFATDPDLQGTRYSQGLTFTKFLDSLNSLEVAVLESVEQMTSIKSGENEKTDHVELAIRRGSLFWLIRAFLVEVGVNYYVPREATGTVLSGLSEVFKQPVTISTSLHEIDNETTRVRVNLSFPHGYSYQVKAEQLPLKLADFLENVIRRRYGSKYQDRQELATAIMFAYEGEYEKAKSEIIIDKNEPESDFKKIKMSILDDITELEQITRQGEELATSSVSPEEKQQLFVELRKRRARVGLPHPTRNIYKLDIDLAVPLEGVRP